MEKKTTKKVAAKKPAAPVVATAPKQERTFTGVVTSNSMNKTITVRIDTMKMNEKYQKKYRVTTKFHVHDEAGKAKVGDTVTFVECRPLSKTKRWKLVSR